MTPFQVSNASHAATPGVLSPFEYWLLTVRLRLKATRRNAIIAGTWAGSKYDSIPEPSWKVTQAHSATMDRVYRRLQAIGRGEHDRGAVGGMAPIKGRQNEKPFDYTLSVSTGALAALEGLKITTAQRALLRLAAVHSIIPFEVRARGEKSSANREATTYRVPPYDDVLAARKADPAIATTHDGALQWNNGRANSRRLLSPELVARWRIEELPARPRKADALVQGEHEAPAPAAAAERKPAEPAYAQPATGIPIEVQKGLDELCGGFCDLAPVIVANLRATAARHDRAFPDDGVVECCEWFMAASGKRLVGQRTRPGTSVQEPVYEYGIKGSPAAFLRKVTADDHDIQGSNWKRVMRYVDQQARRAQRRDRELHESIARSLQQLREAPADPLCMYSADELARAHPETFERIWREDDLKHGGDGAGLSWTKVAKGARGP